MQVSLAQGRKAVRLNSGVRPVQKQMPVNKRQAKLALFFPALFLAFDPRHKLRAGKNAGTPFLGSAFQSEMIGRSWPSGSHG